MGRSPVYKQKHRHKKPSVQKPALQHREQFQEYVLAHSDKWHRLHLGRLYRDWNRWNESFFEGRLSVPYLILAETSIPRSYGDCSAVSSWGGSLQIRIRPSLLTGKHPSINPGPKYAEGRYRHAADILLHEMIHQWQRETLSVVEKGYGGHGPSFRDKANEIGRKLDLPPVRAHKKRGKDAGLLSCAHWPHVVRSEDYYLGALRSQVKKPVVTKAVLEDLLLDMELSLAGLRCLLEDEALDEAKIKATSIFQLLQATAKKYGVELKN